MRNVFAIAVVSVLLMVSGPSSAQDTRDVLVQKIAEAQGLEDMFEQQLSALRKSMQSSAYKLFDEAIADAGGQVNPKQKAAFERYLAGVSTLFTAKEITDAWRAAYGKDLSEQELQEVLRYHQSPVGRKDVAASKRAMTTYTTWMTQTSQARSAPLLRTLVQEMQAAKPRVN